MVLRTLDDGHVRGNQIETGSEVQVGGLDDRPLYQLDRDHLVETEMVGGEDDAHTPLSERALDAVLPRDDAPALRRGLRGVQGNRGRTGERALRADPRPTPSRRPRDECEPIL